MRAQVIKETVIKATVIKAWRSQCFDGWRENQRKVRALATTLTLDKAIAAPATTGESHPAAASGKPIIL
jgi:hypothetical protein